MLKKLTAFFLLLICFTHPVFSEPKTSNNPTRVAIGSCNMQTNSQLFWRQIAAEAPELFLMLGDNIYADTDDMAIRKQAFDMLFLNLDFLKIWKNTRVEAIWDDHDFSKDNIAGTAYPQRDAAQKTFLDAFQIPANSPRRMRPGIYTSWIEGAPGKRLQVIMLDTRYFKTQQLTRLPTPSEKSRGVYGRHPPSYNPFSTILGKAQWKWLEEELRKPAEIRIIASGSQVVSNESHAESWANFPLERKKLFRLIKKTKAAGVFFITGDTHFSELSKTDEGAYPLYDFTSSSFNQTVPSRSGTPNSKRIPGKIYMGANYGMIEIDWDKKDPEIRLITKSSENGSTQFKQIVKLSELQLS